MPKTSKKASPKSKTTAKPRHKRKADQYNDPKHNYRKYWKGREY